MQFQRVLLQSVILFALLLGASTVLAHNGVERVPRSKQSLVKKSKRPRRCSAGLAKRGKCLNAVPELAGSGAAPTLVLLTGLTLVATSRRRRTC